MAISIDWIDYTIHIPKNYLTLVGGTLYDLDTNQFRLDLKDLEDSVYGMPNPKTHNHNTTVTVAGITYARVIEILPPYSIEFEDGQYTVVLRGSNNNIFDVASGILVQNQVQVIPTNAAGLVQVSSGSGLSTEEHDKLMQIQNPPSQNLDDYKADVSALATIASDIDTIISSLADIDLMIVIIGKLTGNKVIKANNIISIYEDDGNTIWRQYDLSGGGRIQV